MVSQNVDQLITAARALSAVEREELLRTLSEEAKRANVAEPAKSARQLWAEEMAKKGVLVTVPPEPGPEEIARRKAWKPIKMAGGSLADDIIRDRR